LTGAPRAAVAVRVNLGATVEYCSVGVARVPAEKNDTTERFTALPNAAAPGACPPVP
jgi:hypothetical protein